MQFPNGFEGAMSHSLRAHCAFVRGPQRCPFGRAESFGRGLSVLGGERGAGQRIVTTRSYATCRDRYQGDMYNMCIIIMCSY